jgi:hypothetical protein
MQYKLCQKNLDAFYSLPSDMADEALRDVYEEVADSCRDRLVLVFTTKTLTFRANEEDDTLSVRSGRAARFRPGDLTRKSDSPIWRPLIGKPFRWGWTAINQQGYCDGALLSFGNIEPVIFLWVVASSIEIGTIVPQEESFVSAHNTSIQQHPFSKGMVGGGWTFWSGGAIASPVGHPALPVVSNLLSSPGFQLVSQHTQPGVAFE